MEKWLDLGIGSCVLRHPEAKRIVERAILMDDNERYEVGEFAVAPNHVHVTVRTLGDVDLSDVLHSWKRNSSRQIGKAPGLLDAAPHLRGRVWQKESFDHIVRNQASLERISRYIRNHRR
jgi:putative transposase